MRLCVSSAGSSVPCLTSRHPNGLLTTSSIQVSKNATAEERDCRGTQLQRNAAAEERNCRGTRLQSYTTAELRDCRVTRLQWGSCESTFTCEVAVIRRLRLAICRTMLCEPPHFVSRADVCIILRIDLRHNLPVLAQLFGRFCSCAHICACTTMNL
ncbi:hypothetical protein POVWA2_040120 [Plasmodium ovale wallikeri]|uniref:Uncharacterized protein n=1 Tax=Plasmodium ovale wallikeri TaxID=864142 RepID=A0A1A8Z9T2_PLAOA|nr:hypothetical protein POVWA1_041560 [Plasmodium ovale wallikeri]SBT40628.1 hypothetical protein POVWA2_040120 [Plasmodium ovale wallikeri]